ncbi:hypothetical protein E1J26_07590 [Xanthomonas hortorum pv. vitians]|nr:hypothetical protein [Xanthomonas hortorum pv. vitians]
MILRDSGLGKSGIGNRESGIGNRESSLRSCLHELMTTAAYCSRCRFHASPHREPRPPHAAARCARSRCGWARS